MPPQWLQHNIHYEAITGSVAYGVKAEDSDLDIVGFCIPPKEMIFPHLAGEILGFGKQHKRFEQYQQHHIEDKNADKVYDVTYFNIVKFFQLSMENNPNLLDVLFVPENCVLYCTNVGRLVKDNRRMFLHKGSYHKFRGYAFAQKSRINDIGNDVKDIYSFEEFHSIPHDTTYQDVINELTLRNL